MGALSEIVQAWLRFESPALSGFCQALEKHAEQHKTQELRLNHPDLVRMGQTGEKLDRASWCFTAEPHSVQIVTGLGHGHKPWAWRKVVVRTQQAGPEATATRAGKPLCLWGVPYVWLDQTSPTSLCVYGTDAQYTCAVPLPRVVSPRVKRIGVLGPARVFAHDPRIKVIRQVVHTIMRTVEPGTVLVQGGWRGENENSRGVCRVAFDLWTQAGWPVLQVMPFDGTWDANPCQRTHSFVVGMSWGDETPALVSMLDAAVVVAPHGAWTWLERAWLQKKNVPTFVAGLEPDKAPATSAWPFSTFGQRWQRGLAR